MKFYLSSYLIGNQSEKLKEMVPGRQIGYIPNALDLSDADPERVRRHVERDMGLLRALSLEVWLVDLRYYFGEPSKLRKKLDELRAIFVSGGNVFVLRQAMNLSGLDVLLKEFRSKGNFLYAGYSAGGCVLSPSLRGYEIVDPIDTPYNELKDVIWDGLGFLDHSFIPHWNSAHPESAAIEKTIDYYKKNRIPYTPIRDGDVLIIE